MTAIRVRVLAGMALSGVVLAGCDTTATGTPVPQQSPPRTTSSAEADRLAPRIENPRDLRGIDPCQLLTAQQLAELTLTEPGAKEDLPWGEQMCGWQNSNLSIALGPDTRGDGLEETYRRKDDFDNFAISTVDGYPAVRVNAATQICTVVVGLADDQALFVDFGRVTGEDPAYRDPCGFAETVAGLVLANLPAA